MAVTEVRGMSSALKAAEEGMKLFESEQLGQAEYDDAAAAQYKADVEIRISKLEEEAAKLTGKDNKKERAAKGKEVSELKAEGKYVDACKIVKGLEPKNGNFVKKAAVNPDAKKAPKPAEKVIEEPAVVKEKKETKPKKKEESAGISPAETKELETLKTDIINRKNELKEQGLSGGQQNKDPQIVQWVARMNELKEKQDPGSTQVKKKDDKKKASRAPLSSEEQKELDKLRGEIEIYKGRLKGEFGYSNKEIKADPDLIDMEARLAAFEKRES